MARTPIIAGNWKMNNTIVEGKNLVRGLAPLVKDAKVTVVVCPTATALAAVADAALGTNIHVGAQNVHWESHGAFTGEISTGMLNEIGVDYCVLGHSERRGYFGETDEGVNKRAHAAFAAGITPIICCGESLEQREAGVYLDFVAGQVKAALAGFQPEEVAKLVIAYEPIWAIGTGKTASFEQAEEVCESIRAAVRKLYSSKNARAISILYGGSMNDKNAFELLAQPDIDGGLIGGASLVPEKFVKIIEAANQPNE